MATSRRLFSKKWVYPAIYLGAAALIIGLMYVKSQMGGSSTVTTTSTGGDMGNSAATGQTTGQTTQQTFDWPAPQGTNLQVSLGFFPVKGTQEEQAKAMVNYDNAWYPHEGYDLKTTDGSAFQVTAAAGGKVTQVTNDKLYGETVIIDSGNGYTERYESLGSVQVKVGDVVQQGQVIGTSGTCLFEKSAGNHLYFAVYKDAQPVDPATVLPQQQ